MRHYSAAVYANENLLLTEVLDKLENEFPMMGIKVFGNSLAHTALTTATNEYDVLPAGMVGEEEILLVLSDPKDDLEVLKDFDGDIVDFTGTFTSDEVYRIEEPLAYLINAMKTRPEEMDAVAYVPAAVFGKNGIDDMINQTRELFTFTNNENKVFDERLAFNMFFSDREEGILAGMRKKLEAETGVDADLRLGAVSTGFVLDVYFKKDVNKEFGNITDMVGFIPTMADICSKPRPVLLSRTKNRVSIAGDYISLICSQIMDAFKDITGE
ncbi:MAG: hypothetical protein AB7E96_02660 [Deferribacterales bacterium]